MRFFSHAGWLASLTAATALIACSTPDTPRPAVNKDPIVVERPEPVRPIVTPAPTPWMTPTPAPTPMPTPRPTPSPTPAPTPMPVVSMPTPQVTPPPIERAEPAGTAIESGDRGAYLAKPYPRIKFEMRNDTSADPDFKQTLDAVQQAIDRRDLHALLKHIDEKRIASGNAQPGMAGFMIYWKLTYSPQASDLWNELNQALLLGVAYDKAQQVFVAPGLGFANTYTEQILNDNIQPQDRAIIAGVMVNIRSEPTTKSEPVEQLTREIVKLAGKPDPATNQTLSGQTYPWWPIVLYNGKKAYVWGKYVRPWNGNQARFEKIDGAWKLVRFGPAD